MYSTTNNTQGLMFADGQNVLSTFQAVYTRSKFAGKIRTISGKRWINQRLLAVWDWRPHDHMAANPQSEKSYGRETRGLSG